MWIKIQHWMFSATGILTSTRIIWFFMEWWDFMCVLPNFYPHKWIFIHNTIFYPHEWIFIHKNEFLSTCTIYVYWLAARHANDFVIYEGIDYMCILPNFYPHEANFYPQTRIFIHRNEFSASNYVFLSTLSSHVLVLCLWTLTIMIWELSGPSIASDAPKTPKIICF